MLGGLRGEPNALRFVVLPLCFVGVLNRRHEVHSNRSTCTETHYGRILGLVLGRVLFPEEITASETCGVLFTELEFSLERLKENIIENLFPEDPVILKMKMPLVEGN